MRLASDSFINMNNRRCNVWPQESTGRNRSVATVISFEDANAAFGYGESDKENETRPILPFGGRGIGSRYQIDSIMKRHKDKIVVLRQCDCDTAVKIRHHPDYTKPLEVELLCRKCHAKAHSQMRKEEERLLLTMISLKMLAATK